MGNAAVTPLTTPKTPKVRVLSSANAYDMMQWATEHGYRLVQHDSTGGVYLVREVSCRVLEFWRRNEKLIERRRR